MDVAVRREELALAAEVQSASAASPSITSRAGTGAGRTPGPFASRVAQAEFLARIGDAGARRLSAALAMVRLPFLVGGGGFTEVLEEGRPQCGQYAAAAVSLRAAYYAGNLGGAGFAFFAVLFGSTAGGTRCAP